MSSKSRQTDVYVHGLEENLIEESPKHGPTLSTSTSSVGGIKTYDPRLELTSKAFFTQAENYIVNEMETINIDYRMLSQMNSLMQNNYAQILPNVIKLKKNSDDIAQRYSKLWPYLQQVAIISEKVNELENIVKKMDKYTSILEERIINVLDANISINAKHTYHE